MKNNITKIAHWGIAAALGISLFATGCRTNEKQMGNNVCPSSSFVFTESDLKLTGLTNNSIDLSAGGLKIEASFSETIEWKVILESATAYKEYKGKGTSISQWWYGNSRSMPVFSTGACKLTLKMQCRDDIVKEFTITGNPNFKNLDPTYGLLLRDFDKNGLHDVATIGTFTGADGSYYGSTPPSKIVTFTYENTSPSPMGGYFFRENGVATAKQWYFGAVEINGLNTNNNSIFKKIAVKKADSVYVNMFLRGDKFGNASADLTLLGSGTYRKSVTIDWTGWKMVSYKLSDFVFNGTNFSALSSAVSGLGLTLSCAPEQSKDQEIDYDFIIITVGAPFFDE